MDQPEECRIRGYRGACGGLSGAEWDSNPKPMLGAWSAFGALSAGECSLQGITQSRGCDWSPTVACLIWSEVEPCWEMIWSQINIHLFSYSFDKKRLGFNFILYFYLVTHQTILIQGDSHAAYRKDCRHWGSDP